MHHFFNKTLLATLLLSSNLYAENVKIVGTKSIIIKTPSTQHLNASQEKHISLMQVDVSAKARQFMAKQAEKTLKANKEQSLDSTNRIPQQVQLGMNDVPVLNQGNHGSCVTFAVTAVLDAAIGQGDYISQLCSLQLGNYLEENGYNQSGWNGTWARNVLSQISAFGVVSKELQREHGCAGLTEYPLGNGDTSQAMPLTEFHQISESLEEKQIEWTPILDANDALTSRVDTNQSLNEIKRVLSQGHRVTFGSLLLDFDLGFAGAVGSNKSSNDSWVLTPEIARDIYLNGEFGGHEMVITGYDDNAVAMDDHNQPHKGLLTLRNSWGDNVGDHGNFYMSYDYFKVLVIEAYKIKSYTSAG